MYTKNPIRPPIEKYVIIAKTQEITHLNPVDFEHKQLRLQWQLALTESAQSCYFYRSSELAFVFRIFFMKDENVFLLEFVDTWSNYYIIVSDIFVLYIGVLKKTIPLSNISVYTTTILHRLSM